MIRLSDIEEIICHGRPVTPDADEMKKAQDSYAFLADFSRDKIIYGINTGFGPMAQYRIDDDKLRELQYNIIRSHACGAGDPLDVDSVRAAMVARLATFVQGKSGVHPDLIALLAEFVNRGITPIIPQHGSVGASGDLVQLAHLALALIGEGDVFYKGERRLSADVLREQNLKPLEMHIREGLAVTNGTSVMTGIGLVSLIRGRRLLRWALAASVLMNETVASYDDFMAEALNAAKPHRGQQRIAAAMRALAEGSARLQPREPVAYNGGDKAAAFRNKLQPYYSLRCVPQILGPVLDELDAVEATLIGEVNSADDNPIVDPVTQNVYHGGNFHGDYVSLAMDKMKIVLTKLTMLMERQMNYLFHDKVNEILPPFVNLGTLGLNYGMQALQFTATSTTAECQTLSNPMYVHSIPNNNDNQDVVSMGTNSALLARRVLDNAFQVMAIHFIALAQGIDCLQAADKLAPATRGIYEKIRDIVPAFVEDSPKYREIAAVEKFLRDNAPDIDL